MLKMSEENTQVEQTEVEEVETETVDSSAEQDVNTETTEQVETELEDGKAVPYKRFKEVNDKYKAIKDELDKLKVDTSQQTNKTEAENTEEVETETVEVEELNPLQDKLTQYEQMFNKMYEDKLEQVPEAFRDLIPEGDSTSKLAWIESAIAKGLFNNKPKDFGSLGANPPQEEQPDTSAFIRKLGRF